VSRYQKAKTNLDFTEARDSEWQWHQLGHMQVCTSLQTDNHASTPPLFFTGRMPFLPPNQQRQSTEGTDTWGSIPYKQGDHILLLQLHLFNGLFSRTTWVSQYHKGKTSLDSNKARDDGFWDVVASAGLYANSLHLAPDR